MEKALLLKAEIREKTGTKATAEIRKKGLLPVIVYGHKQEPVAVSLNRHDFVEGLHHGHRLFDVKIGGKTEKVIVKDVQYDHLGKDIIHADLVRVDVTETVKVTVPIELKGTAAGTHEGGVVIGHADHLEIECRVTEIPETITVSVKELHVGENLHAGDVELAAGLKLMSPRETLIATCSIVAAAKTIEEIEEEEPTAPEVIGEEKAEEEQEGEGQSE